MQKKRMNDVKFNLDKQCSANRIDGFIQLVKQIYKNPTANIMPNEETKHSLPVIENKAKLSAITILI